MISSSAALLAATGMLTLGSEPLSPSFMEGNLGSDPFPPSFTAGDGEGDLRGEVTRGDGTTLPSLHAYSRAKLCNCLFCFEINRCFQRNNWPVIAHAIHTGGVYTQSSATGFGSIFLPIPGVPYLVSNILVPLLWRTPEVGSRTLLFSALSNDPPLMANGVQYVDALCHRPALGDDHPKIKALRSADAKWSARLWNVSLHLLTQSPARNVVKMAP
jgi:hypothetical protein